ncbi:uncharacterized protein PV09_02274 [Verruconis gallopava]|uniref:TPR1-like CTLH-containing domain-containing protein n=1 Tax=Verruconis gallopava TaxID=253628 RepID=A0A0D2B898_9PEZI|nr:uncharacterized protein PV09_02274 [Verruconis gallopava]KIW07434.1 hypothetical protein PV09_02274 [Verruconis gallopava]
MRLGSTNTSQSPAYSNGSSNGLSPTSKKYTNGHSNGESNGVGVSQPLPSKWFGHSREEVARILIQSLNDLGYPESARTLSKESGYELEGPEVAAFRHAVLHGEWAEAEALLFGSSAQDTGGGVSLQGTGKGVDFGQRGPSGGLTLSEGANIDEMRFWLKQQKYLELLENRDQGRALMVLRQELTPLGFQDTNQLHHLSSLLMCKPEELKQQAGWDGAEGASRSILLTELSKSISPSTMIPEHRLAVLLHETKQGWIQNCLYHNTVESPSLYLDHLCDRSNFPSTCVRTLADHEDEVWCLAFSNNGKYLATASKDKYVYIYDVDNDFKKVHILAEHHAEVCYISWSPDDSKLVTCSREKDCTARIWNTATGGCIAEMRHFEHPVSAATWAPDSNTFVIGSQDHKNSLSIYRILPPEASDEEYELVYTWSNDANMRIFDVALSPDGQKLVALLVYQILVYDFFTRELINRYEFGKAMMTSVKISADSKHMLVGMNDNKIRLMAIDTGEVLQTFEGHKQANFMIKSVFGGANESFVVSGSEDSKIYIWRTTGHFVEALDAHSPGCVNAVAWHPRNHTLFASAGDDRKVKIWSNKGLEGVSHNGYTG